MNRAMRNKKLIFDFGSTYFTLYSEGRILLRKPCAVILKKSLQPTVVASGEEALARRDDVTDEELFLRPVRKGAVSHREGCILLIRNCVSEAVGRFARPSVCVLVGCGLNSEQRLEIEKVFVDAGYADIFLMESLLGLMPFAAERGIKVGIIVGGECTEVGLFEDGGLIAGYTMDIGSDTVNVRIKDFIRESYKLAVSEDGAEELKIRAASLYPNDYTRVTVAGRDALTGRVKKLTVVGKELYPEAAYVFGRILKVADAALMAAPIDTVRAAERTGILFAGGGSLQEGLRDYAAKAMKLPVTVADRSDCLPFSGAERLANDPSFTEKYLDLKRGSARRGN